MKVKTFGLLLFFLLTIGTFLFIVRHEVKRVLPREGEIEIVGGVYTPYLLLDSALYFLKGWDESLDFALSSSFSEKARFELVFANKRLLEMEKLAREGKFSFTLNLATGFSKGLRRSINYAKEALVKGEDIEALVWLFQESFMDQQKIFKLLVNELPLDKKDEILEIQQQSIKEIGDFLKEAYVISD